MSLSKTTIFALGALFGSFGVRLLSSKDAKKIYTHCTAAVLRARADVLDQATILQENCMDIYEEAKVINEERAESEETAVVDSEVSDMEVSETEVSE